ncbi:hypothetical protein O1R50_03475 [Glycomyces luteolus]|uniref:Uncharacterized protein n=1 Tax=Glycomyces luteolus TaxID=2670330 RepID=A0A9X3P6X9_9ACTN|nr:hypothetical protein [Glycomyces luteolus]MDA1358666.1 hypothetical protein [Glycomyces luteolus]
MRRSSQEHTTDLFQRLGEVTIAARPAAVLWPGRGDAVAIDFLDNGHRYAAAYRLDGAARLDPQPRYEDLHDQQHLDALLVNLIGLWSRRWRTGS